MSEPDRDPDVDPDDLDLDGDDDAASGEAALDDGVDGLDAVTDEEDTAEEDDAMLQTESYGGPERRTRDRSKGVLLRRREQREVQIERRRGTEGTAQVAAALEMHLDQVKSRAGMVKLLEQWLTEARREDAAAQDRDYLTSLERSIDIVKNAPDIETGVAMLQRQDS